MASSKVVTEKAQVVYPSLLSAVEKMGNLLKKSGNKNVAKQALQRLGEKFSLHGAKGPREFNWESWRKSQYSVDKTGKKTVLSLSHAEVFEILGHLEGNGPDAVRETLVAYLVANLSTAVSLATIYTLGILDAGGIEPAEFAKERKLFVEHGAELTPEYMAALRVVCEGVCKANGYEAIRNIFAHAPAEGDTEGSLVISMPGEA
jgi:hypothetical protein